MATARLARESDVYSYPIVECIDEDLRTRAHTIYYAPTSCRIPCQILESLLLCDKGVIGQPQCYRMRVVSKNPLVVFPRDLLHLPRHPVSVLVEVGGVASIHGLFSQEQKVEGIDVSAALRKNSLCVPGQVVVLLWQVCNGAIALHQLA